jgi:deoxyribodipyrimidine photo-lyase
MSTSQIAAEITALVWFRNDLRTHDHQALVEASRQYQRVVGIYVLDPAFIHGKTRSFDFPKVGAYRLQFILESLTDLRTNLRNLGSELYIRVGDSVQEISKLAKQFDASAVFAHEEITDEEISLDGLLEQQLNQQNIGLYLYWGSTLYHPDDIPFSQDDIPLVFTNYRKTIEKKSNVRGVLFKPVFPHKILEEEWDKEDFPTLSSLSIKEPTTDNRSAFPFTGGESAALTHLHNYCFESQQITTYKQTRNGLIGKEYSTKFSPWLAIGAISPRRIYHTIKDFEQQHIANDSTYWVIFELIWRDFFRFTFWRYENILFQHQGLLPKHAEKPSTFVDEAKLQGWKNGNTGIPFIDANMRELKATGFMSNRGRQNVASYLIHVLHCDWRWGAEWFESQLLDYDPCSNWGNWAYVAGVGNDPRVRYFNAIKQANDYDKQGKYVKLWIPDLTKMEHKYVHTPYLLSKEQWQLFGVQPDVDYPYATINPEKVYEKLAKNRTN